MIPIGPHAYSVSPIQAIPPPAGNDGRFRYDEAPAPRVGSHGEDDLTGTTVIAGLKRRAGPVSVPFVIAERDDLVGGARTDRCTGHG